MSNYTNGSQFERRIAVMLMGYGFEVVRSAGSHGPADLVALKRGLVVLVQCKGGQAGMPLPEHNRLWGVASLLGAVPVLVTRDHVGRVSWQRLTGAAVTRKPRPVEPWSPVAELAEAAANEVQTV